MENVDLFFGGLFFPELDSDDSDLAKSIYSEYQVVEQIFRHILSELRKRD